MKGYYEDPEETKEVFTEDGWLKTGDVGYLDDKGMLFITGRAKSMIVLNNGKKAFPEEIENSMPDLEEIANKMVFAIRNARSATDIAIIFQIKTDFLDRDMLPEDLRKRIEGIIREANERMPNYKSIKFWAWTKDDFVMTSTLKIKRQNTLDLILQGLGENYLQDKNGEQLFLQK